MNDEEVNNEEIDLKLIKAESMMDCAMRELNDAKEMIRIRKEHEHEEMDDNSGNTDSRLRSDQ